MLRAAGHGPCRQGHEHYPVIGYRASATCPVTPPAPMYDRLIRPVLERVFVDSVLLHHCWHCHRIPERSFAIKGRQFHVCARCTGIIVGLACSFGALPLAGSAPLVLAVAAAANLVDGSTQLLGWRKSTNVLRFSLGVALGLALLPSIYGIVRILYG